MNTLENKLAELLLETAIKRIEDASTVSSLVASYGSLLIAACNNPDRHKTITKDACGVTSEVPTPDVEKTTVAELCSVVNAITAPAEEKPARTRRTKAQIEADKAEAEKAAAAAGVEIMTDAGVNDQLQELKDVKDPAEPEPEAEEVQIDDVVPETPKITHGKIQERFTLKSTNIAKAGGDVSGFKFRLREMLAEFGSPAGISKLPEANLAAFYAKLVNLT